jgi:hypothetical protein
LESVKRATNKEVSAKPGARLHKVIKELVFSKSRTLCFDEKWHMESSEITWRVSVTHIETMILAGKSVPRENPRKNTLSPIGEPKIGDHGMGVVSPV